MLRLNGHTQLRKGKRMVTGLIDYIYYYLKKTRVIKHEKYLGCEQEILRPMFKCYSGKYLMGSAENHIDLAQLMVEHGLAKITNCNFNDIKPAVAIFNDAIAIYNWKVNKVA